MLDYDVAIAGSGLVALLTAHALTQAGFKVVCLAAGKPKAMPNNDRAIALSAASLVAFGQWRLDALLKNSAPIRQVHVSVKGRYGTMCMDADAMQVSCLGRVASAKHLHEGLRNALLSNGVSDDSGLIKSLCMDAEGVRLHVRQGDQDIELTAALLLVADGAGSLVSQHLGLHTMVDDYHQCALAAHVHCSAPQQKVAYERFLATGPLALLPTTGATTMAMVWALPSAIAKTYAACQPSVFNDHLQQAFGFRLGRLSLATRLACFPLQRKRTRPLSHPGMVLLGNAASTCHPVAGQGLNLAVRDVVRLLGLMLKQKSGFDAAVGTQLGELFATASVDDHKQVTQLTHGLAKLFGVDSHVSFLGGQGLCLIDAVPGFKKYISRRAMGYGAMLKSEVLA